MAKSCGVKHWEIANYLGIGEQTIMRWLRVPLTEEKERVLIEAISHLAKGEC